MINSPLDWRRVKRLLLIQSGVVFFAVVASLAFGKVAALSAFLGGVIALGASAVFAFWVFAPYSAQQSDVLLARLYIAEIGKLLLIVGAFAVVFVWFRPLNAATFFVSFFLVQVVSPLLVALVGRRSTKTS